MDIYNYSNQYRKKLKIKKCKSEGIYYTPQKIVKYMVNDVLRGYLNNGSIDINDIKILDIACGCGRFFGELIESLPENKNIYAIDKDKDAIDLLKYYMKECSKDYLSDNIIVGDALYTDDFNLQNGSFDLVIGNPPYVGFKNVDKDYANRLREDYKDVYVDKSDLHFCFFKKAMDLLKVDGICYYIVPRYFLESFTAVRLRKYLEENTEILKIIDFKYSSVFDMEADITPIIIKLRKKSETEKQEYAKEDTFPVDIETYIVNEIKKEESIDLLKEEGYTWIDNTSWSVMSIEQKNIREKISYKDTIRLGDIVTFKQGVITGCDRAFVFSKESDIIKDMDERFVKKWIKTKNIKRFYLVEPDEVLIHTSSMDESDFTKSYKEHIEIYKDRLSNRREVKRKLYKWYKLQWSRSESVFTGRKIVFPYMSKNNRFVIDDKEYYFSADVYSFKINENYSDYISLEYLAAILNSNTYEKYMHSFLKNLGKGIYEYYPYRLLETNIFLDENYEKLEKLGKTLLNKDNKENIEVILQKIDCLIENSLKITDFEKK